MTRRASHGPCDLRTWANQWRDANLSGSVAALVLVALVLPGAAVGFALGRPTGADAQAGLSMDGSYRPGGQWLACRYQLSDSGSIYVGIHIETKRNLEGAAYG
jgi:hypothetical protein